MGENFIVLNYTLRSISMRFFMFCSAFYEEMHCVLRSNRR